MHRHEIGVTLDDERYSLQELAEHVGVSTRTVRYYITEGLLEPPVMAGHRSYYTGAHRDRLLVIGRLKDAFLPLREIRKRLAGIADDALPALIAELDQAEDSESAVFVAEADAYPANAIRANDGSASDYINSLLNEPPVARHRRSPLPAPIPVVPPPIDPEERRWRRIAISGDAELTIDDDLYSRKKERVDALIEWAKRVLGPDEH